MPTNTKAHTRAAKAKQPDPEAVDPAPETAAKGAGVEDDLEVSPEVRDAAAAAGIDVADIAADLAWDADEPPAVIAGTIPPKHLHLGAVDGDIREDGTVYVREAVAVPEGTPVLGADGNRVGEVMSHDPITGQFQITLDEGGRGWYHGPSLSFGPVAPPPE